MNALIKKSAKQIMQIPSSSKSVVLDEPIKYVHSLYLSSEQPSLDM